MSLRGVIFARYQNPSELYCDEQGWANGYLSKLTLQNGSELVVPNVPVKFSSDEMRPVELGPELGEHTESIMKDLGYSDEDIEKMEMSGAVVNYEK